MKKIIYVYSFILFGGLISIFSIKLRAEEPVADKFKATWADVTCTDGSFHPDVKCCFKGTELVCEADPWPCAPPPAE